MKYVHLYAGPDGESHFKDVEVDLSDPGRGSKVSKLLEATGLVFRSNSADYDLDWHEAPRKQFIVNLTGEVEITASDGEVRRFGPGSIMLADDIGSKGHLSKAIGTAERLSLFVHVP